MSREALHDVTTRRRQLEAHMLASANYLLRADRELKRRISYLYLLIGVLIVTVAAFDFHSGGQNSTVSLILITVTSLLAILNVALFIQAKTWLHRLNEAWLHPEEREILKTLKLQHEQILTRLSPSDDGRAELN